MTYSNDNKKQIQGLLEDKINDVFAIIQDQEGITSGDIEPLMAFELDELTEKMAVLIAKVIEFEKHTNGLIDED